MKMLLLFWFVSIVSSEEVQPVGTNQSLSIEPRRDTHFMDAPTWAGGEGWTEHQHKSCGHEAHQGWVQVDTGDVSTDDLAPDTYYKTIGINNDCNNVGKASQCVDACTATPGCDGVNYNTQGNQDTCKCYLWQGCNEADMAGSKGNVHTFFKHTSSPTTSAPTTGAPTFPPCENGVISEAETDIDCGGGICPGCSTGNTCLLDSDCGPSSDVCQNLLCTTSTSAPTALPTVAPPTPAPPTVAPTTAYPTTAYPTTGRPTNVGETHSPTYPPTKNPTAFPTGAPTTPYPTNAPPPPDINIIATTVEEKCTVSDFTKIMLAVASTVCGLVAFMAITFWYLLERARGGSGITKVVSEFRGPIGHSLFKKVHGSPEERKGLVQRRENV